MVRASGSEWVPFGILADTFTVVASLHSLTRAGSTLRLTVTFSLSSLSVMVTAVLPTR